MPGLKDFFQIDPEQSNRNPKGRLVEHIIRSFKLVKGRG